MTTTIKKCNGVNGNVKCKNKGQTNTDTYYCYKHLPKSLIMPICTNEQVQLWKERYICVDPITMGDIIQLRELYYINKHYTEMNTICKANIADKFERFMDNIGYKSNLHNVLYELTLLIQDVLGVNNLYRLKAEKFDTVIDQLIDKCPNDAVVVHKTIIRRKKPKMLNITQYNDVILQFA